jgi:hypothetical protein
MRAKVIRELVIRTLRAERMRPSLGRKGSRASRPTATNTTELTDAQKVLVDRYVDAFERYDVDEGVGDRGLQVGDSRPGEGPGGVGVGGGDGVAEG